MGSSKSKKMATARPYKQDLPPKGGYEKIQFKRIPVKPLGSGKQLLMAYAVFQTAAFYRYAQYRKEVRHSRVENRGMQLALQPMLMAERDRAYMKELKRRRDAEIELMEDVPGWECGTYYGIPVYKTVPDEMLPFYFSHPRQLSIEYGAHFKEVDWERESVEYNRMRF